MRVLGIDYGTKRIGIAIGDNETKMAVPFCVADSLDSVIKIINDEKVELVVVGMPLRTEGGQSEMGKQIEEFINALKAKVEIGIETQDERFTTKEVENAMKGYGDAKKGIDKDAAAASLILQTWLDKV